MKALLDDSAKTLLGAAALAFLTALLGVLGTYFPLFQVLIPVTLGVVVRKSGLVTGTGVVAGALMLLFFMLRLPWPSLVVVETGLPGLALGLLFKNHVPGGRALATAVGTATIIAAVCLLLAWRAGLWVVPVGTVPAELKALAGLLPMADPELGLQYLWHTARLLGPANFLLWAAVLATAAYFILWRIFRSWGLPSGEVLAWRHLRLPWYALWLPITGLALTLAGDQWHWPVVAAVGRNLLYLAVWPFFAVGSAVAAYYLYALPGQRALRFLVLAVAIFYWPFLLVVCTLIGVLDPVCNWRRLFEGRREKK